MRSRVERRLLRGASDAFLLGRHLLRDRVRARSILLRIGVGRKLRGGGDDRMRTVL
jgi:hypothetical protein